MKKNIIFILAFAFCLTSCQKSDIIPSASTAKTASPQNHCYTITNTETVIGYVEYRLKYTDCNGVNQNVPLPMGQSINICSATGAVQTNFAYSSADLGVC